jgi:hypothetical protein
MCARWPRQKHALVDACDIVMSSVRGWRSLP